jgi:hypothetical protein
MKRYTYLLIIWTLAACCAMGRAEGPPENRYGDSKYVPMCLERRCKEPKRNAIYAFTGPPAQNVGENKALLGIGYFRQIRDDLEIGAIGIGTDRGFIGWAIGAGARF